MVDAALAPGYAGVAAHEEEVVGLPTFAQFKKHATFRTDLTDFGVDLRQLSRLLVECEYGLAAGGMGLGDVNILFNSLAKRSGALTYEGVLRLCRLLRPRLAKLEVMMASSDDQGDPVKYRAANASSSTTGSSSAAGAGVGAPPSGAAGGAAAGALGGSWAAPRALPTTTSLRSTRGLNRGASMAPVVDFAEALAGGEGPGGGGGLGSSASGGLGPPGGGRGVSFMQVRTNPDRDAGSFGPGGHLRPASASRASPSNSDAYAASAAGPGAAAGPSTSGRSSPVPTGLASLMALKDPPVLLREQLPAPACPFAAISARISGIQVLYRDGEMTRVVLAVRDLQRDWEQAASAAAVAKALRRQAHKEAAAAAGASAAAAAGPSSAGGGQEVVPKGEIPLEGRLWLLLLHGCALMLEGNYRNARKSLMAAEALFDADKLGLEHPYHYCLHMFFGLLGYYEQKYEEAIEKFETARGLAELVSRRSLDATARRNAAACLNNKGVCHSLLGNRSEAVVAFRAAYQLLRAVEGVPDMPEAVVALRNLNKALKQGFALNTSRLRPTSAPPMYAHVGSTNIPPDKKLQVFLQTAITMRAAAPVTSAPQWSQKVTAEDIVLRKKLKEIEKKAREKAKEKARNGDKAKGGAKPKKPPAFDAMTNYPFASYAVANVKLAAKKKGRKKKAAAA